MPAKPDLIVFLCPNGHRLNGPASLEGKPGQCPHCGIKFRVPSRDDPEEDEGDEMSGVGSGSETGSGLQGVDTIQELPKEDSTFNLSLDNGGSSATRALGTGGSGSSVGGGHAPMAEIFLRLWTDRDRGSVLELHLASGQVLVPEKYSRDSSRRGYGVFAVKDPDGTYTVTAVKWDAVMRINVRHLGKLPKKMFD